MKILTTVKAPLIDFSISYGEETTLITPTDLLSLIEEHQTPQATNHTHTWLAFMDHNQRLLGLYLHSADANPNTHLHMPTVVLLAAQCQAAQLAVVHRLPSGSNEALPLPAHFENNDNLQKMEEWMQVHCYWYLITNGKSIHQFYK